MPKATVNLEGVRFPLKTLEEGYVVLRKLSYGEYLQRTDKAMKMVMEQSKGTDPKVLIDMAQTTTTMLEFQLCIIEHNLENDEGVLLKLGTPKDFSSLDPKVGQEIAELINDMNQFKDGENELFLESGQA